MELGETDAAEIQACAKVAIIIPCQNIRWDFSFFSWVYGIVLWNDLALGSRCLVGVWRLALWLFPSWDLED